LLVTIAALAGGDAAFSGNPLGRAIGPGNGLVGSLLEPSLLALIIEAFDGVEACRVGRAGLVAWNNAGAPAALAWQKHKHA
jgi:hypothetical protein